MRIRKPVRNSSKQEAREIIAKLRPSIEALRRLEKDGLDETFNMLMGILVLVTQPHMREAIIDGIIEAAKELDIDADYMAFIIWRFMDYTDQAHWQDVDRSNPLKGGKDRN